MDDVNTIMETKIISVTLSEVAIWILQTEIIHFSKSMCSLRRGRPTARQVSIPADLVRGWQSRCLVSFNGILERRPGHYHQHQKTEPGVS